MRRLLVGVLLLGVLGVVSMGWFSEFQRRVVFPGPEGVTKPLLRRFATEVGANELAIRTDDGETIYGWHRAGLGDGPRRVVLYFHGNASSVLGQLPLQQRLIAEGWDYVGIHYRGYPGSTGIPSETGTRSDAQAAWGFVTRELGVPASRVAIHGRSLGGGVAAQLASEVKPGAVVLESTFTSVPDLAREQFGVLPVGRLLKHRFVTRELAGTWNSPTLVAHGSADSIIPVGHGRELAQLFSAMTYIEASGIDHNNVLFDGERADRYIAFLDDAIPREAK
ncbi:MAG: alpha/beta fold hydrolase [Myxococcota bacterium]